MIVWGALVGALLGWIWCDFEPFGLLLGGLPGALGGLGLRSVVRREIADRTAGLRAELEALRASRAPEVATEPAAEAAPSSPRPVMAPLLAAQVEPSNVPFEHQKTRPVAIAIAFQAVRGWLFGGNTVVRVGVVILFIGLAFLASYAASAGLFPIEYRLALVAVAGMALLFIGFRTRERRTEFAVALQGTGVATIYLTIYAAVQWYGLATLTLALILAVVVCGLTVTLALLQASQPLAVLAFAGGFAAPLLLASDTGEVAVLFGYYTLLNFGVLALVRQQSWRVLGLVGFGSTFGMATLWQLNGGASLDADQIAGHAFVLTSVVLYALVALLSARSTERSGVGAEPLIDTTLLFGPAVAGFGLELALLGDRPFASAFAALGFAGLYLALAAVDRRRGDTSAPLLTDALIAIGVGFVTVAVPLALGARWTSAVWALEGAAAVWVGTRQGRWLPRAFGLLLQAVAAVIFFDTREFPFTSASLVVTEAVGAALIAGAAIASSWWLSETPAAAPSRLGAAYGRIEGKLTEPLFLAGFAVWCGACALQLSRLSFDPTTPAVAGNLQPLLVMLAVVASAWVSQLFGRRLNWRVATWPAHGTLVVLAVVFVWQLLAGRSVFLWPDVAIWAAAFAIHLRTLFEVDRFAHPDTRIARRVGHVGTAWLATAILVDGLVQATDGAGLRGTGWSDAAPLLAVTVALLVLTVSAVRPRSGVAARRWPWAGRSDDYGWIVAAPLAALVLIAAAIVGVLSPGDATPLPYLPLLNPVDLTLMLAVAAVVFWARGVLGAQPTINRADLLTDRRALAGLGGVAFVLVNTVWLRASHQLLGVGWSGTALMGSFVVQAGLAIGWTALALALMVAAHRRGGRVLWLVGAVLLALTVIKLLLIDLTNIGGAVRIVTFIGVGALMLIVGYAAPLPPRGRDTDAEMEPAPT